VLGTIEGLISPSLVPLKPAALGRFAVFRRTACGWGGGGFQGVCGYVWVQVRPSGTVSKALKMSGDNYCVQEIVNNLLGFFIQCALESAAQPSNVL